MGDETVFEGAFQFSQQIYAGSKQIIKSDSNSNLNKVIIGYLNKKIF